jgi:hypothetical protein
MLHRSALGRYPGIHDDLVLKATATGVTFLRERKFNARYLGSKKCKVDAAGEFWSDNRAYEEMLQREAEKRAAANDKGKRPDKKKTDGSPPIGQSLLLEFTPDRVNEAAISQNSTNQENFSPESAENATKVAKKERIKAYTINKREVRQRILAYNNTNKGQKELYFWTVTFPEGTPDDVCYQAFNTWLTALRTPGRVKDGKLVDKNGKLVIKWRQVKAMLRDYLWIAERQLGERLTVKKAATGTIHFHIAIPHFMNVTRANALMRGTLKNLAKKGLMPGAVCNGKNGEQYYLPSIAKYNGVHISRNKKTGQIINFAVKRNSRALATYLTKYITKNNAGVPDETGHIEVPAFTHLAWHNSRGFSCLFTGVTFTIAEFNALGFRPFLNGVRKFEMNFATFIPWLYGPPPELYDHLFNLNSTVLAIIAGEPLPVFNSMLFISGPRPFRQYGTGEMHYIDSNNYANVKRPLYGTA